MIIKQVDSITYAKTQFNYSSANFLQSAQMGETQLERRAFLDTHYLLFLENEQVVGQAIVNFRQRYKFFKEALILHGPLLDYSDVMLVEKCFDCLEHYIKQQKVDRFLFQPYLAQQILDNSLNNIQNDNYSHVIQLLKHKKFTHILEPENNIYISQLFIKDLHHYADKQAIYKSFSNAMQRNLKKFNASCVKTRELSENELDKFYHILQETSQRKGFSIQPLTYFKLLKKYFKSDVKFIYAYLDCVAYKRYLDENIQSIQQHIKTLTHKNTTKKQGLITVQQDKLNGLLKRQMFFNALNCQEDELPLSAHMLMCYGNEVVSVLNGNYGKYLNFGGASVINWEMIQFAYQSHKRYNFYGTIELEDKDNGTGNFNYKRQFNGELHILIGLFTKTFNPLLLIVENVYKKLRR